LNKQRERHRRKWDDNIKIDLKEIRCECVDWIEMAQESCAELSLVFRTRQGIS